MILYFIITFIGACILGAIVCGIIRTDSDSDWFRVYVYDKMNYLTLP